MIIQDPARVLERFWPKVDQDGPVPPDNPILGRCWLWLACKNRMGYGQLYVSRRAELAHRVAHHLFVGPVPDGLTIDHLCRVRHCVNPDHLEVVTQKVNTLRGQAPTSINARATHCVRGHPLSGANLYFIKATGSRRCRACQSIREKEKRLEVRNGSR